MIIKIYEGDRTTIQLGKMKSTIEVTSGIRQGCCISTLLFKLITFTIIEELNTRAPKYRIGAYEGNSLWLADDAVIIARSTEDLLETLEILKTIAGENDLKLNKKKTKILIVRGPQVEKIGEYEVTKEVKYLGINLGGRGKDIFAAENESWLEKAEKKANELISQIKSSCDIVLVGRAIWKAMAIPQALYGRAVIPTTEKDIKKLQRIENRVWRYLLGIGGYSTIEGLR